MPLTQPVGQKRLTNVAIVRLKLHGKRFEVAAYKNKVLNWREGIEKDINEVLQVVTVFTNVGKGEVANAADLKKVFGTIDQEEICRKILKSGDLQVSDREREVHAEGLLRDIVQIVVERCVNPQSGRQLTALTVENALKSVGFSVKADRAPKVQALKAIEALCMEMPENFARAKMRLRVACPEGLKDELLEQLDGQGSTTIEEECAVQGIYTVTFVCDPSHFRELDRLVTVAHAGEDMSLHVVTSTVLQEGTDNGKVSSSGAGATTAPAAVGTPCSGGAVRSQRIESTTVAESTEAEAAAPRASARQKGKAAPASAPPPPANSKKALRCSTCCAEFEDAAEYKQHCRSDWHNYNLKRKVKSAKPLSREEYAEIALDIEEGFLVDDR